MTHTPGPWTVGEFDETLIAFRIYAKSSALPVLPAVALASGRNMDGAASNARLIAVAPDLLRVAQGALGYLLALPPRYRPDDHWLTPLRAAIGDATGEDPC